MKKKLFTLLAVLLTAINASAYDFQVNGIYYNITSPQDLTCEVTECNNGKYSGDIKIPSNVTYNGKNYSVTAIGHFAFDECVDLTAIEIPNSVTSIGIFAFYWCLGLTAVNIPSSVTMIGDNPFATCINLSELTVEGDNFYVMNDCLISKDGLLITGLNKEYIEIPNSVVSIGSFAFMNCISMTAIEIPNSVTSIGDNSFFNCIDLQAIEIPNSVVSIGFYSFQSCSNLKEITSLNQTPPVLGSGSFDEVDKSICVVRVPALSIEEYKAAEEWKDFMNFVGIEETPTSISDIETVEAKAKMYNLQGVQVSDGYKGIVIRGGKKMLRK